MESPKLNVYSWCGLDLEKRTNSLCNVAVLIIKTHVLSSHQKPLTKVVQAHNLPTGIKKTGCIQKYKSMFNSLKFENVKGRKGLVSKLLFHS